MSELHGKRVKFTRLIAQLITWTFAQGYTVMKGADDVALVHMKGSLHYRGLADDLLTFAPDGTYLTETEDYKFMGDYWKSLDPDCRWGGDFKKPDGNHFSCGYEGRS
jgi:hypothetical protein